MKESALQAKILKWLKANGFWVFKTIVCNRNGIPDIIGCTPDGILFAIEVKIKPNKPSALQSWNIEDINSKGGIAFVAYDFETVETKLGSWVQTS